MDARWMSHSRVVAWQGWFGAMFYWPCCTAASEIIGVSMRIHAYPGNSFEDHVLRRHIWTSLIPSTLPLSGDVDFAALAMRYELSGGFIKKLGSCWGEIRDAAHRLQTPVLHRPIGHSYFFFPACDATVSKMFFIFFVSSFSMSCVEFPGAFGISPALDSSCKWPSGMPSSQLSASLAPVQKRWVEAMEKPRFESPRPGPSWSCWPRFVWLPGWQTNIFFIHFSFIFFHFEWSDTVRFSDIMGVFQCWPWLSSKMLWLAVFGVGSTHIHTHTLKFVVGWLH